MVIQGRLQQGKDLIRGRMLVHTEEEWRDRWEASYNNRLKFVWVLLGSAGGIIMIYLLYLGFTFEIWEPVLALLLITGFIFGIMTPLMVQYIKRNMRRFPAMGLYEGGLQVTPYVFIPYSEIASTERAPAGGLRAEGVRVALRSRPPLRVRMVLPAPLTVRSDFLGEEGVRELERRVSGILGPAGPPKLVLYEP